MKDLNVEKKQLLTSVENLYVFKTAEPIDDLSFSFEVKAQTYLEAQQKLTLSVAKFLNLLNS